MKLSRKPGHTHIAYGIVSIAIRARQVAVCLLLPSAKTYIYIYICTYGLVAPRMPPPRLQLGRPLRKLTHRHFVTGITKRFGRNFIAIHRSKMWLLYTSRYALCIFIHSTTIALYSSSCIARRASLILIRVLRLNEKCNCSFEYMESFEVAQ